MAKDKPMGQEQFDEVAAQVDGTAPEGPRDDQLNLSDIRACVTIIDIVTKRGAFEGSELADVGAVRNRLDSFLIQAAAAQEAANPTEETAAE